MVADNAIRGQLHSLMDPAPHIIVTYTYVSFGENDIDKRPFRVSSRRSQKHEIDILSMADVSFRCHRTPPRLSRSSSLCRRFDPPKKRKTGGHPVAALLHPLLAELVG